LSDSLSLWLGVSLPSPRDGRQLAGSFYKKHAISLALRPTASDSVSAHGFRISFTPLGAVLFTLPSRYWCAIGRRRYLALEGGPPSFRRDLACPAVLPDPLASQGAFAYGTLTHSGRPFQRRSASTLVSDSLDAAAARPERPSNPDSPTPAGLAGRRFRLFPFRSPLLREYSLLLGVLRCFSSPGALGRSYAFTPP
jgi:hypothetical protein